VVVAVSSGLAASATVAAGVSGAPTGAPGQQTHPVVVPRAGSARTRFTARLTLADAAGHAGVFAADYRIQITPPSSAARCRPRTPPPITTGAKGEVVRVALGAPARGWCVGRHALTVFLERGPYCPKPAGGRPPVVCPEFATQELDVGEAHFTVAAPPRRDLRRGSAS
jgi:hypothetical protein